MKRKQMILSVVLSLLLVGFSTFNVKNVNADESYGTNTIVKDDTKGVWRRVKEGDFIVEIQTALVDKDGSIVGWTDGLIDDDGEYNDDFDWVAHIIVEQTLHTFLEQKDGSGNFKFTVPLVAEGLGYYRVRETNKYQLREMLADGTEGKLLYVQADGTHGTTKTNTIAYGEGPLQGVDYDPVVYYIKTLDAKVVEVRKSTEPNTDSLSKLGLYSEEQVQEHANVTIPSDAPEDVYPIDYFVEHLKNQGIIGVSKTEFSNIGSDYPKDSSLSFNNKFDLPKGEVEGKAIKRLLEGNNDWELEAGQFSFELKDDKGVVLKTITNNKDGSINFTIPVDHEGIFKYTLSEVKGDNEIIFYDDLTYEIEVKVRFDRLTNKLVSELTYKYEGGQPLSPGVPPYFVNSFELPESEVIGKAKKKLVEDGKEISLKAGQFTFVLKDNQNTIIETVTNDANGDIEFTIPIKREGVFKYTLEETKGNASDITYDPNIYGIEVTAKFDLGINDYITTLVYTDLEGNPLAQGVIPIFENTQTPPEKPVEPPVTPEKPDLPNTGIGNTTLYIAIILILTGTVLILNRKDESIR